MKKFFIGALALMVIVMFMVSCNEEDNMVIDKGSKMEASVEFVCSMNHSANQTSGIQQTSPVNAGEITHTGEITQVLVDNLEILDNGITPLIFTKTTPGALTSQVELGNHFFTAKSNNGVEFTNTFKNRTNFIDTDNSILGTSKLVAKKYVGVSTEEAPSSVWYPSNSDEEEYWGRTPYESEITTTTIVDNKYNKQICIEMSPINSLVNLALANNSSKYDLVVYSPFGWQKVTPGTETKLTLNNERIRPGVSFNLVFYARGVEFTNDSFSSVNDLPNAKKLKTITCVIEEGNKIYYFRKGGDGSDADSEKIITLTNNNDTVSLDMGIFWNTEMEDSAWDFQGDGDWID